MSSSWPPELKAWVHDCLAKATPSTKASVNAELKQILFKAHADNTIQTTDWSTVQLDSLRNTSKPSFNPSSLSPQPPPPPPPSGQGGYGPYVSPARNVHVAPVTMTATASTSKATLIPAEGEGGKKKKRRKKNDTSEKSFPSAYHFPTPEETEALARRAARFNKPQTQSNSEPSTNGSGNVDRWFGDEGDNDLDSVGTAPMGGLIGRKRLKGKGGLGYSGDEVMEVDPNVIDWDSHTIRGTNTKLEKSYLRLTSEPSPADIRPLPILKQTLALLKAKWKENHNYAYALDQFKSMRQDLTVQRIKNEFTVEVYEIHARIALEAKDLGEYNQCQTMLRQLYELGLKGHPQEFLSYRIIYLLHTRNRSDMAALLAQLTPAEKADPGVHHALQVHAALATSNYIRFFRLFNVAPAMSGYIMDHFVERERMSALGIMTKGYMSLPLTYVTATLSFDSDQETHSFLSSHSAAIYVDPTPSDTTQRNGHGWKSIRSVPQIPLHERMWDCRKAHAAISTGMEKYRVVDLKGQVD